MSIPSWAALSTGDVRGRPLFWLLDLHWSGRTYHISTEEIDAPTGDAGASVRYHAGMDPLDTVTDNLALLSDTPAAKSVDLAVYLPPGESVATRIAQGHQLGAITGQLHLWAEGSSAFVTILDGIARGVSWYDDDSPITLTLEESPSDDLGLWPPLWARVDATTWPAADPAIDGEYYPLVIGSPGRAAVGTAAPEGSPALYVCTTVGSQRILVSDLDVLGSGGAQTVTIYDETDGSSNAFSVTLQEDGRGRTVSVCDVSVPGALTLNPGDAYWTIWGASHGIVGDSRSTGLSGAGDVLIWWLRRSTIRWDRGRVYAAAGLLNRFRIDTYVQASEDERIVPWEWVRDNLLPILPVSPRIGPQGLYFVTWDYYARSDAAVAQIEYGRNADRDGPVDVEGPEIPASTVEIEYQYCSLGKGWEGKRGRTGEVSIAIKLADEYIQAFDVARTKASHVSVASDGETIPMGRHSAGKTEVVWDDYTAGLILQWWLRRDASPIMTCDYLVSQEIAAPLTPGAVVSITDTGRGLTDRVALVSQIELSLAGQMRVSLRIPPVDRGEAA